MLLQLLCLSHIRINLRAHSPACPPRSTDALSGDRVLAPGRVCRCVEAATCWDLLCSRITRTLCWRYKGARPWTRQPSTSRELYEATNGGAGPPQTLPNLHTHIYSWACLPHVYLLFGETSVLVVCPVSNCILC